jgi:hypothetical protein
LKQFIEDSRRHHGDGSLENGGFGQTIDAYVEVRQGLFIYGEGHSFIKEQLFCSTF